MHIYLFFLKSDNILEYKIFIEIKLCKYFNLKEDI